MDLTKLNLGETPKPKATNFGDQNSVDEFLENKKFRQHCKHLRSAPVPVQLHLQRLYMPQCDEGRFEREGIAALFVMPSAKGDHLGPETYVMIPKWAPFISCPSKCKGYKNRTVAKIEEAIKQTASWVFHHVLKPAEVFWAMVWAWLFR